MQMLPILMPFLGAVIGAIIGATMSPLIQWHFEKKRQKFAYKRELIAKWRHIIEEVARDHDFDATPQDIHKALMRKGEFLNLVSHLNPEINISKEQLESARTHNLHPVLSHYLDELVELEREWELI